MLSAKAVDSKRFSDAAVGNAGADPNSRRRSFVQRLTTKPANAPKNTPAAPTVREKFHKYIGKDMDMLRLMCPDIKGKVPNPLDIYRSYRIYLEEKLQRRGAGENQDLALRQRLLIHEFITSEASYRKGMHHIIHDFMNHLKAYNMIGPRIVDPTTIYDLFSNIQDIYELTCALTKVIDEHVPGHTSMDWASGEESSEYVGAIIVALAQEFHKFLPRFRAYNLCVGNYERAYSLLLYLRNNDDNLDRTFLVQELCVNADLGFLLSLPCFRLIQYSYIIDQLANTIDDEEDAYGLLKVHVVNMSNMFKSGFLPQFHMSSRMKVAYTQERVFNGSIHLVDSKRFLIRTGPLRKTFNHSTLKVAKDKEYMFYLFNDCILYGANDKGSCKFKHAMHISTVRVQDIPDSKKAANCFYLIGMGEKQKSMTLQASSEKEKHMWMRDIQSRTKINMGSPAAIQRKMQLNMDEELTRVDFAPHAGVRPLSNGWFLVKLDTGMAYYYQQKTGVTSLAYEDVLNHYSAAGEMASWINPSPCTRALCPNTALQTCFLPHEKALCALHIKDQEFDYEVAMNDVIPMLHVEDADEDGDDNFDEPYVQGHAMDDFTDESDDVELDEDDYESEEEPVTAPRDKMGRTTSFIDRIERLQSVDGSTSGGSPRAQKWRKAKSENGDVYYWSTETNETTWERPAGFESE